MNNIEKPVYVISFSGGRTSAYLCYLMKKLFSKTHTLIFIFLDTGAEHPKSYDFVRKVNKEFDLNLVCLRVKVNPEKGKGSEYTEISIDDIKPDLKPFYDVTKVYGNPSFSSRICTREMKNQPAKKYCDDRFGKKNYETWLGIRIDEPKRLGFLDLDKTKDMFGGKPTKPNPQGIRYLAEISDFTKEDVLDWWESQPFDLEIHEHLGNCVFCVHKGAAKLALAARQEPEMAKQFMDVINNDEVRLMPSVKYDKNIIYRGYNSLESIIKMYEDVSEDELTESMRHMKRYDTNSCSESCEAMMPEDFELEIQEEGNEKT